MIPPPDRRREAAKRARIRIADEERARHTAWVDSARRTLRRQPSTEAAVKRQRTICRVRERASLNDAIADRMALGRFASDWG